MILQALYDYYDRKQKSQNPDERLPQYGFELKEIPFIIEINTSGRLVQILDTRAVEGKRKRARKFLVPQGVKKTSGVAANLLWETAEYVLGVGSSKNKHRIEKMRGFEARIHNLSSSAGSDEGLIAVMAFLQHPDMNELKRDSAWQEIQNTNPVLSFRLHGDINLVCQRPLVLDAIRLDLSTSSEQSGICLITGEMQPIERLHSSIKGVWGAQTSGANIVSFNCRSFESYGKTQRQGENAPIGKVAVFAYTTALNHLLAKESAQRVQVGDASTVFWAEMPHDLESMVSDLFGEPARDEPDRGTEALKVLYESVQSGRFVRGDVTTPFHVLGLAPNAARISIRFWETAPANILADRFLQHFRDINIAHRQYEPDHLSIFRLLTSVATQAKADNIPPNLGGEMMRAILENRPYPAALLNAAVQRCRAEQMVTYPRAAILKACINRDIRHRNHSLVTPIKELDTMLDADNPSPAYRLGRLFATLEKIQEEASPGINTTIRDRYYGAASSNPAAVFTSLLRLKNHHLGKLPKGRAVQMEKLIGEIIEGLKEFPRVLSLHDQGYFAIGYYQQRQYFFNKQS